MHRLAAPLDVQSIETTDTPTEPERIHDASGPFTVWMQSDPTAAELSYVIFGGPDLDVEAVTFIPVPTTGVRFRVPPGAQYFSAVAASTASILIYYIEGYSGA